ncbi:ABC transporter ATP-binding protein [Grimontia sp. NTOU-MAR1]|uniref:ABC transporter ATP-binding protein n=1 Tax=Grimontia sp. NTOU-MAR1 TaxID=3111011 RepID=UPI002DB713EE|nr:ABC transporter ATP-binding protein [Grimontia sp. NTOU-MAR1]WRV98155.1 ABC transporter ATP-binding protein [Grimontia sp. NTOU-MAR1]
MDEKQEARSGWQVLRGLLVSQKYKLMTAVFFSIIAAGLELAPFWIFFKAAELTQVFYTEELNSLNNPTVIADSFYALGAALFLVLVFKTIAYATAYTLSHQSAFLILADTRQLLVSRLAWAPLSWFKEYKTGQLKQAVMQDVEKMENFFAHHTVEVSTAVFGPIFVAVYLFWIDWRLALAALAAAPVAMLSSFVVMRGMSKYYDQYHSASVELNSTIVEYIRNIAVMKLFRQDSTSFGALSESLDRYFGIVDKVTLITVPRWALFTSLLGANVLFILPLGMYLVQKDMVGSLDVVMAVLLGAGMLRPLLKISHFFNEIQEILSGVKRLTPILDVVKMEKKSQVSNLKKDIELSLREVSFSYEGREILKNISASFNPGTTSIVLGMSGSGKSTLLQIIAGLIEPNSGDAFVNEISVSRLNDVQRASLISLASQEAFLFKGTIKENILMARPEATSKDIDNAIHVAGLTGLIRELPAGLDTQIEERGIRLSGGEKQRIALARALLVEAPIVLLDEATAYADNLTQKAFYQNLKKYYPNTAVVVVAHRTYGLEEADQIILLEKGEIRAVGKHQQLMRSDELYKALFILQLENDYWALGSHQELLNKEVMSEAISNG